MRQVLILIVLTAFGFFNAPRNANAKSEQNKGKRQNDLTAEESANLFADEVGRWKVSGKDIPTGGDVEHFDDIVNTRWLVKGKSIESTFQPLIDGKRIPFVVQREYDPKEGVFIWRTKGEGYPETSGRDRYNPESKTYRGKYTHSDGAKETKTCLLVNKDKMLITSQFELDGKIVFTRELVFRRLPTAETVAILLADEIGRWEITGKSMPVGGDIEPFEDVLETRWKVKGESIESNFSPLINGERVPFIGDKVYDFSEGVFIWRSKGEGFPETVSREQYDPETKTYHGKATFPDGAKEASTFKRVSKNESFFTSKIEVDGKVVFRREAVFKRVPATEKAEEE